ncbi:MAG: hypothetical protein BWY75_00608 [bacterium ADurb.Bin425]|nr:MAG: hypothetical protein BWY75_00608 [bacterium ADurb.Bin425]
MPLPTPLRAGLAAFPHPAPTSGLDAKALTGIRVGEMPTRKPAVCHFIHSCPREMVILLTAVAKRLHPEIYHPVSEGMQCPQVGRHIVVIIVSRHNCS